MAEDSIDKPMSRITLEEAWEQCPEAMVAFDRDHPDRTIHYIYIYPEHHQESWGSLTISFDGIHCWDYHADIDRWVGPTESIGELRKLLCRSRYAPIQGCAADVSKVLPALPESIEKISFQVHDEIIYVPKS